MTAVIASGFVVLATEAAESWGTTLMGRVEAVLAVVAGIVIGAAVILLLARLLWAMTVRRDRHPTRAPSRAKPTVAADPELKVIIDLTDSHLEVMRQRRAGSKLNS